MTDWPPQSCADDPASNSDQSRTVGGPAKLNKDNYMDHEMYCIIYGNFEFNVQITTNLCILYYEQKVRHVQTIPILPNWD